MSEKRYNEIARRIDICVVLAVALPGLYLFPYFRFLQHANEMPRLFVTESLAERGSLSIDRALRRHAYFKKMDLSRSFCLSAGLARAASRSLQIRVESRCREHFYSNKAPGPSVVAVPFYWAAADWARLAGRGVTLSDRLWWSRFGASWLATLLALFALAVLGRRLGLRDGPRHTMILAYGLGSMALVYSVQFMSHQLAAAGAILSLAFLTSRDRPRNIELLAAGFAAGVALAADYQSALLLAVLAVYGLVRVGFRRGLWAVLGGLPVVMLLAFYHWVCFGWPTWTGYEFLVDPADLALHVRHPLGFVGPQSGPFRAILWSAREGLLFLSPWLGLALFGLARFLRAGLGTTMASQNRTLPEILKSDSGSESAANLHRGFLVVGLVLSGLVVADHAAAGLLQREMVRSLLQVGLRPSTSSSMPVVLLAWWAAIWVSVLVATGFQRDWVGPLGPLMDGISVGAALVAPMADALAQGPEAEVALWTLVGAWQALGGFSAGGRPRQAGLIFVAWNFGVLLHLLPWQGPWHWVGWFVAVVWAFETARSGWSESDGRSLEGRVMSETASAGFGIGLVGLATASIYLWFISSLSFWHGGWQVGPRYLAVALPILALAAGAEMDVLWNTLSGRTIVGGLVAVGLCVYVTTSAVFPHFPKSFNNPLFDLVWYLMSRGYVAKNLAGRFLGWHGVSSLVPLFGYVGLLAAALLSGWTEVSMPWNRSAPWARSLVRDMAVIVFSAAMAAAILFGYSRLPRTNFNHCCRWIVVMWDKEQASRWNAP